MRTDISSPALLDASTPQPAQTPARIPRVLAVGGGKGGVGKSMLSSNIALLESMSGKDVVLMDADLGGANLHTCLGMKAPDVTLSDFVYRRTEDLNDVAIDTPVEGLRLISGAIDGPAAANPKHTQKARVIRHIGRLNADLVVVDLGAGTGFNTLDFYLAADQGIVAALPEPTSIENVYRFVKASIVRIVKALAQSKNAPQGFGTLLGMIQARNPAHISNPQHLLEALETSDPVAAEWVRQKVQGISFNLVINQVRSEAEARLGPAMEDAARKHLGVTLRHVANIPYDPAVWRSVRLRKPVIEAHPESGAAAALKSLHEGLQI